MSGVKHRAPALVVPLPVALAFCLIFGTLLLYEQGGALHAIGRRQRKPFWFVHLPKVGGTAVEIASCAAAPTWRARAPATP